MPGKLLSLYQDQRTVSPIHSHRENPGHHRKATGSHGSDNISPCKMRHHTKEEFNKRHSLEDQDVSDTQFNTGIESGEQTGKDGVYIPKARTNK